MDLEGDKTNRSAIGARIKVVVNTNQDREKEIHKVVSTGGSFGSSSLQQEIGLGNAQSIQYIEISWPASDQKQVLGDIEMNAFYKIREGMDPEKKKIATVSF